MRYIGSKEKVIPFIESVIFDKIGTVSDSKFTDLFSGTVAVAKHFKRLGAKLLTNDYMAFSYALQIAYIRNNGAPVFGNLIDEYSFKDYNDILSFLSKQNNHKGFFYSEYCMEGTQNKTHQRNYFSEYNSIKIDSIRICLREWYERNLINEDEFYVLLASVIEAVTKVSNISGTYGAFLKFDERRKHRDLTLDTIDTINSNHHHQCYCEDTMDLIHNISGDILYLDPPYNQRQYPPYYHILETVTLYDNPSIYGKTGRRPYTDRLSPFCIKNEACNALGYVIKNARFKHIFLSYNTDGIISKDEIFRILKGCGQVEMFEQHYRRYKSNSNGVNNHDKNLKELIFYVRK